LKKPCETSERFESIINPRPPDSLLYPISMRFWPGFFMFLAVIIPTTMIVPQFFGLQNFTQWGGMYTSGWCTAHLFSEAVSEPSKRPPKGVLRDRMDSPTTQPAFGATMHSRETCIAWGRSFCDRPSHEGWIAQAVYPNFRKSYPLGNTNVCDLPPDSSLAWFPR